MSSSNEVSNTGSAKKASDMFLSKTDIICSKTLTKARLPCFGLDIGGTLVKIVYFEPVESTIKSSRQEQAGLEALREFLLSNVEYCKEGIRDDSLEMKSLEIGDQKGNLHFIRFPTCHMASFLDIARRFNASVLDSHVCATGGGAFKFEKQFREVLGIQPVKYDELDCLIHGIRYYINSRFPDECYYWSNPQCIGKAEKVPYDFETDPYPYLVVSIGTGVSINAVKSAEKYRVITGTSLGGGSFLGLCSLLTNCETFEEAIELAAKGDGNKVDQVMKDVYGGGYEKLNIPLDFVVSSFGKMYYADKRSQAKPEDIARATLATITDNICLIALMCTRHTKIKRVIFVGSFLRKNEISMKLLASKMEFLSRNTIKALFLRHEGYFGAVGALLELMTSTKIKSKY